MEDGADRIKAFWLTLKAIQKRISLLVIGKAERGEIFPLGILAEYVGDENVLFAAKVQGMNECTADETGAAGDEDSR
jgi:hypothetical protein